MGWLYKGERGMAPYTSPKSYLDAQFTYERVTDGVTKGLRVLASSCPGNRVWYAAAQETENGRAGEVFAVICLIRWNPRAPDGMIFGYKSMTEHCGPFEVDCPEHILDMLTPTGDERSLAWRKNCRDRIALRRRKITDGMKIKFDQPITFQDGYSGDEFVAVRGRGGLAFRVAGRANLYRISGVATLPWRVIPETKVYKTVFA